jgi:hypothetical protein
MENPGAINAPGNAFAICLLSPHSRKADQPKVIPVPLKARPLPCKTKPTHQIGLSSAKEGIYSSVICSSLKTALTYHPLCEEFV